MFRENQLKKKLLSGKKCLGCWLFMGSPVITELLALSGFDALIIDQEHAPGSLETATHQLRAASSTPTTMLVRVADIRLMHFRQVLDAGAEGVMAANVQSADEVETMVRSSLYPMRGIRGIQRLSRAADWGFKGMEYYRSVAENIVIIGLIESDVGVAAIPEICKVDGLDMLFIGDSDLSASIGKPGEINDPEVRELITEAERRILEGGVRLGGVSRTMEGAPALFERGYSFVTNANDVLLIKDSAVKAASFSG